MCVRACVHVSVREEVVVNGNAAYLFLYKGTWKNSKDSFSPPSLFNGDRFLRNRAAFDIDQAVLSHNPL